MSVEEYSIADVDGVEVERDIHCPHCGSLSRWDRWEQQNRPGHAHSAEALRLVCKTRQDHFRGGVDRGVTSWDFGDRNVIR